jgi:hypothetical protein
MTSMEWLMEQIMKKDNLNNIRLGSVKVLNQLFEQAKEMHKQEIIDAFGVGCHHESKRLVGYQDVAEQYYNETFKNQ